MREMFSSFDSFVHLNWTQICTISVQKCMGGGAVGEWRARTCVRSVAPCAIQVDFTRVQFDVLLFVKDAIDDWLQNLM